MLISIVSGTLFAVSLIVGVATLLAVSTSSRRLLTGRITSAPLIVLATGSPYLAAALLFAAFLLGARGESQFIPVAVLLVLASLILTVPIDGFPRRFTKASRRGAGAVSWAPLTVTSANVLWDNREGGAGIGDEILAANPDVLVLLEYGPRVEAGLRNATDLFPYSFIAEPHACGPSVIPDVAIFSKTALTNLRTVSTAGRPLLLADTRYAERTITVAAVHTHAPTTSVFARDWLLELRELSAAISQVGNPVLVAGDFNASASHAPYRAMLAETRLTDATRSLNTWAPRPGQPAVIHLDHILVSDDWAQVGKPRTTAGHGSDHRPVIAQVVLA
jgi:endonuclease/exonuclease/phosphatase (EEP) superfamily protein YafD